MIDIEDYGLQLQRFSWPDYLLFVIMLMVCVVIGIYFGFVKTKKSSAESEYLMGGRSMSVVPVSLSLIASFISGITLLGLPTEVYLHGTQYLYVILGVLSMGFVMSYFYLPVFHDLHITSTYEFVWQDYLLFVMMLMVCVVIGIYFGFVKTKRRGSAEIEYLMGGRSMLIFPIALSLIASFISGITLLGLPTEVYLHGIQYAYVTLGVLSMGFVMSYFYLPVFHDLHITSTYEYLESRFNRSLRMFGSILFVLMNIGYLPIVVYVPALAFNQVTGIDIHIITPVVVIICVFYTCVGGIKAVVYTDCIQVFSMFLALCLVAVKGTMDLKDGGFSYVYESALKTNRLEAPIFDINPTLRHTIWSQVIGGVFYWVQTNAVSQNMIQRYLSLPTLQAGKRALWIFVFGVIALMMLCSYNGLLIYATYQHCDPLTTGLAKNKDQMLPLFVMDVLGQFPGLSGLFIAGVFSAALSSLSTCLNSLSAVVLEDFFKTFVKSPLSVRQINWIMRSVVVVVGVICVALVYVVEKMGTVLQLTMSLEAITNGPLLGIFTMGIFLPWIKSKSALTGGICGVIFMTWLSLKAQLAIATGQLEFPPKKLDVDQCYYSYKSVMTSMPLTTGDEEYIFPLFKVSYMWYTCLGACFTMLIALISSAYFGFNDPKTISPELLTPCVRHKIFPKQEDRSADTKEINCHHNDVKDTEF